MVEVGTMMSARFAALEERLLPERRIRPPLASDKGVAQLALPAPAATFAVPAAPVAASKAKKDKKANKAKAQKAAPVQEPVQAPVRAPVQGQVAPEPPVQEWTTVGKKGKPQKATPKQAPKAPKRQPKLRSPRTAAVVLTLRPEAKEAGLTYAQVIHDARAKVSLESLGIEGVRFRRAATGATIIEVPGEEKNAKADQLAAKLGDCLDLQAVRIQRPTPMAELRVSGLDDSVTSEELVAAVAKSGGCLLEAVKSGEIRRSPRGMGTAWVRCPVEAAKTLTAGGRLLVGWVSASVKLLEPRTRRCYRCLETGHVSAQCSSPVNRGDLCYNCAQPGHTAGSCSAPPQCPLCSAVGKKADHRVGSKACPNPKASKAKRAPVTGPAPPTAACNSLDAMDVAVDVECP